MKILPVAAIVFAMYCPGANAIDETATTATNLQRCINAHEDLNELYEHIGKQDINVSAIYSQYEVAVRNVKLWSAEWPKAKVRADRVGAKATARTHFKEVNRKLEYWEDSKEEKLKEISGLMFSREFKIKKLTTLRRFLLNCKSFPISKDTIKEVCGRFDYRPSFWCRERF